MTAASDDGSVDVAATDARLVQRILTQGNARSAGEVVPDAREDAVELWRASRAWLRFPDVVGLEVGLRAKRGIETDTTALIVLVRSKDKPQNPERVVPARIRVPGSTRTVATDVTAVGDGGLEADLRFSVRRRPCAAGTAIRATYNRPATFACLLAPDDAADDRVFLLSNAHAIAKYGHARPGLPVYQPRADRRRPDAVIAELTGAIAVRTAAAGFENTVDAAIALVTDRSRVSSDVYHFGPIRSIARTPAQEGGVVRKFGPATGATASSVARLDSSIAVHWRTASGRLARAGFHGVVRCSPRFTDAGDSGAAVLSVDGRLLGLHFASNMTSSFYIPIDVVLAAVSRELGLDLGLYQSY